MLRFEDCLEFSELTENEVRAISKRLRVPDVVACAIGSSIAHRPRVSKLISRMSTPAPKGLAKWHIAPAIRITRNDRQCLNDL